MSELASDLERITGVLAEELASPGAAAPPWSATEWCLAAAVAAIHGISPLLHARLRWEGPPPFRMFLASQAEATRLRYARLESTLHRLDEAGRRAGVALLPLKGAALHARRLYAAGERPMADLDLHVAPRDDDAAARMLARLGFQESSRTWKHRVFVEAAMHDGERARHGAALGEHANRPVKIELHTVIAERLPLVEVDITAALWPAQPRPGLNDYRCAGALLQHLLLHAAGDITSRTLRLIHLHDIVRLAPQLEPADWNALRERDRWWACAPLMLAARHGATAIPAGLIETLAAHCPRALRRAARRYALAAVSLSNPRIEAFPGIEWTRTPAEGLRYAARRIRPSRDTLAARADLPAIDPWRGAGDWARLPQWRRVLRWLVARPQRIETLHPVRLALATLDVATRDDLTAECSATRDDPAAAPGAARLSSTGRGAGTATRTAMP